MPTPQTTTQANPELEAAKRDPLRFFTKHQDLLERLPVEKGMKAMNVLFNKYMAPRYQAANQQFPLDNEEMDRLRKQFMAKMLGIPIDPTTNLKDVGPKPGVLEKTGAALEAGGAGVLGGLRSIVDLDQ